MTPEKLKEGGMILDEINEEQAHINSINELLNKYADKTSIIVGRMDSERNDIIINDQKLVKDLLENELLKSEKKYSELVQSFKDL